jgi:hypothetical protein
VAAEIEPLERQGDAFIAPATGERADHPLHAVQHLLLYGDREALAPGAGIARDRVILPQSSRSMTTISTTLSNSAIHICASVGITSAGACLSA